MAIIYDLVAECWPRYIENMKSLYHVGDEMVVSAALNLAIADGLPVIDGGTCHSICRWWTARRPFQQVGFASAVSASVLHLPADKEFLSVYDPVEFDVEMFKRRYVKYARKKLIVRRLSNYLAALRGQSCQYVPSINERNL